MNFLSEFRIFHQDYKMPLPKGYRINDAGEVERDGEWVEGDNYRDMLMFLSCQIKMTQKLTTLCRWATFWGILGVVALILNIIF